MVPLRLRLIWLTALAVVASVCSAPPAAAETRSTGTAFVVHSEGLLLTCFHVIKDAGRIDVRLNGKIYRALVVGTDVPHDLALLQVDATSLPALSWTKAEEVELGEEVRAFGFPLTAALGSTLKVTRGTISGVEREEGQPVFQIDSAVNPGNSGGPLVNDRGEVVGVVVARFADVMGVGYVTPVDAASPLLRGLPPLRPAEKRPRFEGPALVQHVSPSVALVSCVPLDETGKLPTPFKRAFPAEASARPAPPAVPTPVVTPTLEPKALLPAIPPTEKPVEKPVEKPAPASSPKVDAPAVPAKPSLDGTAKPAAPAGPVVKPAEPAKPEAEPQSPAVTAAKPEASPAAKPTPAPATQPLSAQKPETPAPAKPNPPAAPAAPKTDPAPPAAKPAPTPPMATKEPAIDVDAELCKIRASDPPEFPQPAAQAVEDTVRAAWTITNATDAPLTIMFRGVEKRAVVIEPRKSVTLMLMPGTYEVAGRLALDTISPFYGTQQFTRGGRYQSRFRVELQ